jgi:hypothetical protein
VTVTEYDDGPSGTYGTSKLNVHATMSLTGCPRYVVGRDEATVPLVKAPVATICPVGFWTVTADPTVRSEYPPFPLHEYPSDETFVSDSFCSSIDPHMVNVGAAAGVVLVVSTITMAAPAATTTAAKLMTT